VHLDSVAPDRAVTPARLTSRRSLLEGFDDHRRTLDAAASVRTFDTYQQRALDLLTAPSVARAFDLAAEPAGVREAYGRNSFGQSCLLARRLAEAGVPMVSVHYCRRPPGWDTHGRHFAAMKDSLCPTLDTAFAALVTDLDRNGLLDSTLVWVNGEFGRTPRVNSGAGRDHWPWAYSQVIAGGGVARGVCVGATDALAAYPTREPHDPSDMVATAYHLLGVPPGTVIHDQVGRPHALVNGVPIGGLLA
jgi:uncharacterized protein (DUF1501 family)